MTKIHILKKDKTVNSVVNVNLVGFKVGDVNDLKNNVFNIKLDDCSIKNII